jgi:hypothetical protein
MFKELENQCPNLKALSFSDDITFLVPGTSIQELANTLQNIGHTAITWGQENKVKFEVDKTEAILFSKNRKTQRKAQEVSFQIGEKQTSFNKEATKWLGF